MENNSELFEFLPLMVEDERTIYFRGEMPERIFFTTLYMVCGVWGALMKIFLLYNLMQQKISERPINILIMFDQTIDFIGNVVINISTTINVSIIFSESASRHGNHFCFLSYVNCWLNSPPSITCIESWDITTFVASKTL